MQVDAKSTIDPSMTSREDETIHQNDRQKNRSWGEGKELPFNSNKDPK